MDTGLFTSMLEALLGFVDQSLRQDAARGLSRIDRGSFSILVQEGREMAMAGVFSNGAGLSPRQVGEWRRQTEFFVRRVEAGAVAGGGDAALDEVWARLGEIARGEVADVEAAAITASR